MARQIKERMGTTTANNKPTVPIIVYDIDKVSGVRGVFFDLGGGSLTCPDDRGGYFQD